MPAVADRVGDRLGGDGHREERHVDPRGHDLLQLGRRAGRPAARRSAAPGRRRGRRLGARRRLASRSVRLGVVSHRGRRRGAPTVTGRQASSSNVAAVEERAHRAAELRRLERLHAEALGARAPREEDVGPAVEEHEDRHAARIAVGLLVAQLRADRDARPSTPICRSRIARSTSSLIATATASRPVAASMISTSGPSSVARSESAQRREVARHEHECHRVRAYRTGSSKQRGLSAPARRRRRRGRRRRARAARRASRLTDGGPPEEVADPSHHRGVVACGALEDARARRVAHRARPS